MPFNNNEGSNKRVAVVFAVFVMSMAVILLLLITAAYASNSIPVEADFTAAEEKTAALLETSTLSVTILSSPWAALDSNKPDEEGPSVFVVEAKVTNLGPDPANNVEITLDYDDVSTGWVLLDGETTTRTAASLGVDESFYGYWFAQYPMQIGSSHQYTVTAEADEAAPVSTSTNAYDNGQLPSGTTAQTVAYVSSGNSGIVSVDTIAVVGVIFTASVEYDLGNNPKGVQLSPAGNPDFDASSSTMLATRARFFNGSGAEELFVDNRLYFSEIPQVGGQTAEFVEVDYVFLPQRVATVRMCSYAGVEFQSLNKYDNNYCDEPAGTVIIIDFEQTFSLAKTASSATILQDDTLTYTLHYTNDGESDLALTWIWDQVELDKVTVLTDTIDPPIDTSESGNGLLAWYVGAVPAAPNPSSSGTITFAVLVDGKGLDLADGTKLVNSAFIGFNRGQLPAESAYTHTITTTVRAPQLELSKSDGLSAVGPGANITYTLVLTNSGSAVASSLVLTDVLPSGVSYQGGATGDPAVNDQTLLWDSLNPIAPNGGTLTIHIPVTVDLLVDDGATLTNQAWIRYANERGYPYPEASASDVTTVQAPTFSISKSAAPDPVHNGAPLTYTLTYSNLGSASASNVVITDVVPLSTTYQSCSGGDTCSLNSGIVTWELSSVLASSGGSVGFTVLVDDDFVDGNYVENESYGLKADQSDFVSGDPVNTLVTRSAGFIGGHTFIDLDGSGSLDPGELGLPNVDLHLSEATNPNQSSDAAGVYLFRVEVEKFVAVVSDLPTDYFRTSPGTVWLESQFLITETVDFGYAHTSSPFGSIYGTVFEDLDGDGEQEAGEMGLQGVTLEADGQQTTTNALGQYAFNFSTDGNYKVVETDPSGYFSTTPNDVVVDVIVGSSREINFGDAPDSSDFASVVGTVFEDSDSSGTWGDSEVGIANVTINLAGGIKTTGKYGGYAFKISVPGKEEVVEDDPVGYFSTTPNEVAVNIVIGGGHHVNFGDVPVEIAQCDGDLYEPDNSLNQANMLEAESTQKHDFCDNAVDWVKFEATAAFEYTMATLSWGQRADTVLRLYDGQGIFLAGNDDDNSSDDFSSELVWTAPTGGDYYLRVSNRTSLTGFYTDYELTLTVKENYKLYFPLAAKAPGAVTNQAELLSSSLVPNIPLEPKGLIQHSCADAYEIDDSWQLAPMVVPGVEQTRSFDSNPFIYAADKDFLAFDLKALGAYTFTVTSRVNSETLLELYDADGDFLDVSDDQQIVWSEEAPGRYYISVSPGPGASNYGCSDEVGYTILVESKEVFEIYFPVQNK